MSIVTVSPKYQVVIPLHIRRTLNIKAGQKMQLIALNNRVQLVPILPPETARGFLRGIDTTIEVEADRT